MTPPRILGVVMARDEWPMVALAITHALSGHVEHVAVLDHASTDASRTGLERLQQEFHFYFWKEATHEVRWMTNWATSTADVDEFVDAIRAAMAQMDG